MEWAVFLRVQYSIFRLVDNTVFSSSRLRDISHVLALQIIQFLNDDLHENFCCFNSRQELAVERCVDTAVKHSEKHNFLLFLSTIAIVDLTNLLVVTSIQFGYHTTS